MSLQDIADCMKGGIGSDVPPTILGKFLDACRAAASDLDVEFFLDSGLNTYQAASTIRGAVLERISNIGEVIKIASSRGFVLPSSPFQTLEQINLRRRIFNPLVIELQDTLLEAAAKLSRVTVEYNDGKISFERKPAYQLTSYEVSVDGLVPQSGDALVDILGYQPDADFIKRKRALDSLAKLDFTKRKPYMLFTADYDGSVLIAWSKMPDASGYRVSKRDVFAGVKAPDSIVSNDEIMKQTKLLLEDDRVYQVLSFYDWLDHSDVMMYVDRTLNPDSLYSFRVSGVQKKAPGTPFIFDVPTSALFMSPALVDQVATAVRAEAQSFGRDPSLISPYPALAEAVYGDPSLGWMLAGCNTVAAIRRDDTRDFIRSLSFIGSTVDGLISAGRSGKLVVPSDIGTVSRSVEDSVAAFGISQTITAVLDGLGLTEFISGKDDALTAGAVGLDRSTSSLARVLSVIDPATATLDPKVLLSTLSNPIQNIKSKVTIKFAVARTSSGIPIEDVIGTEVIDLTTHEGIGRLVQILRTVYDFYPGALS